VTAALLFHLTPHFSRFAVLSQDGHARFWLVIHGFGTLSFLAGMRLCNLLLRR
jgi:hypothetical protein